MLAAGKGNLSLVRILIDEYNANCGHLDKMQRNCLFYAILSNTENVDVVKLLLEKGNSIYYPFYIYIYIYTLSVLYLYIYTIYIYIRS